jgi:hypothetical protein
MFRMLILAALSAALSLAADVAGKWELRAVQATGEEMSVQLVIREAEGKLTGTVYAEGEAVPVKSISLAGDDLSFQVQTDEATFTVKLTVSGQTATGSYKGSDGTSGKVSAKKA